MKILQILFGIAVVALFAFSVFPVVKVPITGNLNVNDNAYSSGMTFTSSTMTNSVATLLIPRATSSRTIARVCFRDSLSALPVKVYASPTSTGVIVNGGEPIYASTTAGYGWSACKTYDSQDAYFGQVWGISSATATVDIAYKQE